MSSFAFGVLNRKFNCRSTILIGSICQAIVPIVLFGNSGIFLAVYCVVVFGRLLVDNGVPAALLVAVPSKIAGPYNAWRMILHYVGTLLGTSLAAVLPMPVMLIAAAVMQTLSGVIYFRAKVVRTHRNDQEV